MTAAEHQRAGAIKRRRQRKPLRAGPRRHQRHNQNSSANSTSATAPCRRDTEKLRWPVGRGPSPRTARARLWPKRDGADLPKRSADENHDRNRGKRDRRPRAIRRQAACHAPDRLRDTAATATSFRPWRIPSANGPVKPVAPSAKAKRMIADGNRKGEPRRQPAEQAVAAQDAEVKPTWLDAAPAGTGRARRYRHSCFR